MADKTSELERIYTIPLRTVKMGTRSKRADRAVREVRSFLTRHMKAQSVWLDNEVNEAIWGRGKFNIRSRLRVRATRFSDGVVEVTLPEQDAAGSLRAEIQQRLEKAAETPVLVPMADEEEEHEHRPGDDRPVTDVQGIGPATAEKLEKAEIESVADLADADPATLAATIGTSEATVQTWVEAARALRVEVDEPEKIEAIAEEEGPEAPTEVATDDSEE